MKKTNSFIAFCTFFLLCIESFGQNSSLYMSREIRAAYQRETRSQDGKPGAKYFQNRSDYNININLDPTTRVIVGDEEVIYKNNSKDTLKFIVVRLYPNIFKKGNSRGVEIEPNDLTDGVQIDQMTINGEKVSEQLITMKSPTNWYVKLLNPIAPNSSVTFSAKWTTVIPEKTKIRIGTYDESSFFVGYFYPQIAVYDDILGWDRDEYTGVQEFYNDYGSFDVKITVPKNFVVWATGVLQNPEQVFSSTINNKYQSAKKSDSVIHIITENDLVQNNVTAINEKNTWHYKADFVSDFAFGTSDHYLWDGINITISANKNVFVSAAYRASAEDFKEVAEIAKNSIVRLSDDQVGIQYPYPVMTVFEGDNGMEFPMIVNDGSNKTRVETIFVTTHEITHSYFPFLVGTNERRYGWIDEGFATMLPNALQIEWEPSRDRVERYVNLFSYIAGTMMEVPPMFPSIYLPNDIEKYQIYVRPSIAFQLLNDVLGKDLFKKCLLEYTNRWNGKHPTPYDLFYTFNDVAKQNLDWFWKPWFFDNGYPDLAIKEVNSSDNKGYTKIIIEKKGIMPLPVSLNVTFDDGTKDFIYHNASIWKEGNTEYIISKLFPKKIVKIELKGKYIPDSDQKNNVWRSN